NAVGWVVHYAGSLQTSLDLQCTQAQGTSGTEDGGENSQDVNQLAKWTGSAFLTDERDDGGRQQLLTADTERGVSNSQTDNRVDCPWVEGPVEHGRCHGGSHFIGLMAWYAVAVESEWLRCTAEQQTNAHARGEHHGNPRYRCEFRLSADRAPVDGAKPRCGTSNNEYDKDCGERADSPAEVVNNKIQGFT